MSFFEALGIVISKERNLAVKHALENHRRSLITLVFLRQPLDAEGTAAYYVGYADRPQLYTPSRKCAAATILLHRLIETGRVNAADVLPSAKYPGRAARKKLDRALRALRRVSSALADAIAPLASDGEVFRWHQSDCRQRIVTDTSGSSTDTVSNNVALRAA